MYSRFAGLVNFSNFYVLRILCQEDFLLKKSLLDHIPQFVAYFACFFVISAYWGCHVRLYNLVVNSNDVLTWLNLVSDISVL
jgi:uncharacterized membrane protein